MKGDLMLYPQGNTNPLGVATADALNGQARVFVKKNANPYQGKNLKLVVIANFHGALTDLQGKTLTQLGALVSSGANVLGAQSDANQKQADFLMDGAADVQTYRWNNNQREISVASIVALRRAAAKLRVRLTPPTNIRGNAGENFTVVGNPQIALVNGVSNTNVLSETMLGSGRTYINNGQTDFQNMEKRAFDGTQFFARPVPFYVYAHAWGNDVNNETYLLIKLRLRTNNRDKDSYYKIPLKNVLPSSGTVENWNRIVRNTVYDIQSTINAEGSAEPTNPVTIQSSIAVEDWTDTKPVDGTIAEAHYLVVTQTKPEMRATDELEIQYISDLPLDEATLRNSLRATYPIYDKLGNITYGTPDMSKVAVSLTSRGGRTFIKVKSPVPINYVPLTINFTAKQKDSNVLPPVPVTVSQLPPIYVTAKQSQGKILNYWTSLYAAVVQLNDNVTGRYLGTVDILNGMLYTIHTIVPQKDMIIGDATETDGSTKKDAESNKIISPEFIISSQWGDTFPTDQYGEYSSDEIKQKAKRDNDRIKSGSLKNLEIWMDVRGGYPGQDNRPSQGRLPYFSPRNTDGNKIYTVDDFLGLRVFPYKSVAQQAKQYYEDDYGRSGSFMFVGMSQDVHNKYIRKPGYPTTYWTEGRATVHYKYSETNIQFIQNGDWRIPTTAELQLIAKIQSDPNSAVKYLIYFDKAWSAETGVKVNTANGTISRDATRAYPKLVFDSYKAIPLH